ncbi:MAG: CoA transferase, partial [Henriciella sp.]
MAAGGITEVPSASGDGTSFKSPASPIRFPGSDDGPKGPSPKPGQHSRSVLEQIGYSGTEIDDLLAKKVIT